MRLLSLSRVVGVMLFRQILGLGGGQIERATEGKAGC